MTSVFKVVRKTSVKDEKFGWKRTMTMMLIYCVVLEAFPIQVTENVIKDSHQTDNKKSIIKHKCLVLLVRFEGSISTRRQK